MEKVLNECGLWVVLSEYTQVESVFAWSKLFNAKRLTAFEEPHDDRRPKRGQFANQLAIKKDQWEIH